MWYVNELFYHSADCHAQKIPNIPLHDEDGYVTSRTHTHNAQAQDTGEYTA